MLGRDVEGISVVICCHNSETRLPTTLQYLRAQQPPSVPWELVIVDNHSSDKTEQAAGLNWRESSIPIKVVRETRLGVRFARERGLKEASYSFLVFVDDDNWLAPDWLRNAYEIMRTDQNLAALGGIIEPAFEASSPAWFEHFHDIYAILTDEDLAAAPSPPKYLPTAGLCLRKAAWLELIRNGFQFQLTGTVGRQLQGGEDTELTLALGLCGWRLAVDSRLRMKHYMPAQRLSWDYLRRIVRNYGMSHVLLDAYTDHSLALRGCRGWVSDQWWYQLARAVVVLLQNPKGICLAVRCAEEDVGEVVDVERMFGRARGLLRTRARYTRGRRAVRNASWRAIQPARFIFELTSES